MVGSGFRGRAARLYRLPELLEAKAQERPIVIAEGEKDVDNLARIGIIATTNVCGAHAKWLREIARRCAAPT